MKRQMLHAFHSLELTRKNDFSQQNIPLSDSSHVKQGLNWNEFIFVIIRKSFEK